MADAITGGLGRDLRHAVRSLLRRPVSTGAALLTLALGLGATAAVFSVVRSVLLRPLPFPEPAELVAFAELHEGRERASSPAGYLDWRRGAGSFEHVAAFDDRTVVLRDGGAPVRVAAALVSGNFFVTLGVEAAPGRTFDPGLRLEGGEAEVVLGHGLWTERFGGDPGVLGRTIRVDDEMLRVVGVAPAALDFPGGTRLWIRSPWEAPPVGGLGPELPELRNAWYFEVVGRLADGVDLDAARAEMAALDRSVRGAHPDDAPDGGTLLQPLHDELVASSRPLLGLLLGAVGLVLLVACANTAGLTLARLADREAELTVRAALGAGGWGLARLVLVESLVLACAGGALGLALAGWVLPSLLPLLPATVPRAAEIGMDGVVLLAAVLATTGAGIVAGVLPALGAARLRDLSVLRSREPGSGAGRGFWRDAVVAGEVAAAVVLVATAVLLVRSVHRMAAVDPGFEPAGLATLRVTLPDADGLPPGELAATWRELLAAARGVPGVSGAALTSGGPTGTGPRATLRIETAGGVVEGPDVEWQPVTPGYLETAGIVLRRGRGFGDDDDGPAPAVAVVSRSLARRAFGDAEPVGRRVTIGLDGHDRPLTVVGVVDDVRNRGPDADPLPVLYRPLAQVDRPGTSWRVAARVPAASGAAALPALRRALGDARPDAVLHGEATGADLLSGHYAERRFVLGLLGAFGAGALLLGAVGVYGVAASAVTRRRREIGVRMAVGAGRLGVVGLVVARGMRPVAAGLALGLLLSLPAGRALSGLLFGVEPGDPVSSAAVTAALLATALLALAVPAGRAASLDPASVLRGE